ncbi:MAG: precorrin-6y C5,15-methyltransferase (decarboxylating) subunit CbiE [Nitrospirae bacterium]|nr:precorrin-6y C5,15-methyltransferase (decarboxylating) subunit CbiE [Nitrospirota bacterium]
MNGNPKIYLVGVEPEGPDPGRSPLSELIGTTRLVIGGSRHLDPLKEMMGPGTEWLRVTSNIPEVIERLGQFLKEGKAGETALVLATGDPLYYGIGGAITKALPGESLVVIPAATLVQRAFALLREPWEKVHVGSLHSKKEKPELIPGRWAFYTGGSRGPAEVCQMVMDRGFQIRNVAILENIGMEGERVRHFPRMDAVEELPADVKPLNMVVMTIEGAAIHES